MAAQRLDLKTLLDNLKSYVAKVGKYKVWLFIAALVLIYGYSALNINKLVNTRPSSTQVQSSVNPLSLTRVDKSVVNQLQTLQNNSVSVQVLFKGARNNPFQE